MSLLLSKAEETRPTCLRVPLLAAISEFLQSQQRGFEPVAIGWGFSRGSFLYCVVRSPFWEIKREQTLGRTPACEPGTMWRSVKHAYAP